MELLEDNDIGQLAFNSGASPYIVPITYYYDNATHHYKLFFRRT